MHVSLHWARLNFKFIHMKGNWNEMLSCQQQQPGTSRQSSRTPRPSVLTVFFFFFFKETQLRTRERRKKKKRREVWQWWFTYVRWYLLDTLNLCPQLSREGSSHFISIVFVMLPSLSLPSFLQSVEFILIAATTRNWGEWLADCYLQNLRIPFMSTGVLWSALFELL